MGLPAGRRSVTLGSQSTREGSTVVRGPPHREKGHGVEGSCCDVPAWPSEELPRTHPPVPLSRALADVGDREQVALPGSLS